MDSGSARLLVVPRPGGGWQLRETAGGPVLAGAATKREMIARAGLVLEQSRGGQVVVLGADGSVQETFDVERAGRRPWWYVRRGFPRWFAPFFFLIQIGRFALGSRSNPIDIALGLVGCVGLVVVVIWVWRSRALDRSRAPGGVDPG